MARLDQLLEAMMQPPPEKRHCRLLEPEDLDYRTWGFSIYRTSYLPTEASDKQWETPLARISEQIEVEIRPYPGEEVLADRVKGLLFLDPVSDASLLEGKSRADVREVHMRRVRAEEAGGGGDGEPDCVPVWPGRHYFLLADAEVLDGVSKDLFSWIKCVTADHDEEERERRSGKSNLFPLIRVSYAIEGWCRMTTRSIVDFCTEICDEDISDLPPHAQMWGNVLIYDGEETGYRLTSAELSVSNDSRVN